MAVKVLKPTTNGQRNMSTNAYKELTKKKPLKKLCSSLNRKFGRNNSGRITCWQRGGGHKKLYRKIDFKRTEKSHIEGEVKSIEYDPYRTAFIMQVTYKDGDKRYHLAPNKIEVGDHILLADTTKIKPGNRMLIKNIPAGFNVYNVELSIGKGGQIVRTAGSSAKIVSQDDAKNTQVQLPSGEVRFVNKNCYATLGVVSNLDHSLIKIGKAGRKRWMGKRPKVRGKAKNPCDHPHGGGEGNQPIGLKYPKTPWGKPALGVKTRKRKKYSNKFIIKDRRKK
jgi:large subunit ribosomal protein L2